MFTPLALAAILFFMLTPPDVDPALLTVAEQSDYTATASSDEVLELIARLRHRSPLLRVGEIGRTVEDREIPLLFLSDPPVENAAEARSLAVRQGKAIVFVLANIHAGEVEGKEAALMLAREIGATGSERHPLLENLILVFAPNYNADGNDRFDDVEKNRPGQLGPARVGIRQNAQGIDLNRDYIALRAPESRALAALLNQLDPELTIDLHTTNGSRHRYLLTYDSPLNPSGHAAPIAFVRERILPHVTARVKETTGYDMWYYGNFNRDHTTWATYSPLPRFGANYQGLRGQMSVLSEAYAHAPFRERAIATHAFVSEILHFASAHREELIEIRARARREVVERGKHPSPSDVVGIRHQIAAFEQPVTVLGYALEQSERGRLRPTGEPKDHHVVHLGRFEPTLSVSRPAAYIVPPGLDGVIELLRTHGIEMETLDEPMDVLVQTYTITRVQQGETSYLGPGTMQADAEARMERRTIPAGMVLVRTAQPLGTLAVYLLEPQSEDGLLTWGVLGDAVAEDRDFPIVRVPWLAD